MITTDETEWVRCSCCGTSIRDTPEENTDHGVTPNPHDIGYGMCVNCGGDTRAEDGDEATVKRRLGWAMRCFCEARFETLRKNLSPANLERFEAMSYTKKCAVVLGLVEKGVML